MVGMVLCGFVRQRPGTPVGSVWFVGYHMMAGIVSNRHGYSGKGGMYNAGRMDSLMEHQGGAHGPWHLDTPDSTRLGVASPSVHGDHEGAKGGKGSPEPSPNVSAARPQPPKSPMRKKVYTAQGPEAGLSVKQYSSPRVSKERGIGDMKPPVPRSGGGEEKPSPSSCRIHVWDAGKEAPDLGVSACNISDVWPFDHPGSGIDGMYRTSHQNAPHAIGYWLAEAVRQSAHHEENFDRADLILLNTYVTV